MTRDEALRYTIKKMGYRDTNPDICSNCKFSREVADFNLVCSLNPVYEFNITPTGTCKYFEAAKETFNLNKL